MISNHHGSAIDSELPDPLAPVPDVDSDMTNAWVPPYSSGDDSDMTDPFAPVPDPVPHDEVMQLSMFWGPRQWREYEAAQGKKRRIQTQRRKIRKELGPILIEGGLLREEGRIRRSLRLKREDAIVSAWEKCRRINTKRRQKRSTPKASARRPISTLKRNNDIHNSCLIQAPEVRRSARAKGLG